MADIFLSHSGLDSERVKPIAERLSSLGCSIWRSDPNGARQGAIDERLVELERARVVLCAWSTDSRDCDWLHAEAAYAWDSGKLLQMQLDAAAPPPPFDSAPAFNVSAPGGLGELEQAVLQSLKGPERPAAPNVGGWMPTIAAAGAPKLVTIALACVLAAFAGAVSAFHNGVIPAAQTEIALTGAMGVAGLGAVLSAYRFYSILRAGG